MKILIQSGSFSIGILDTRNYVIFDHTKPKSKTRKGVQTIEYEYSYFSRLDHAVREVARLSANDQAADLRDWLEKFNATIEELTGMFSGGGHVVDLKGVPLVKTPKKEPSPRRPLPASACKCANSCAVCACSDGGEK